MNRTAKALLSVLAIGFAASLWTACIQTSATTSLSTSGSSGSGVPTQTPSYTPTATPPCTYGGSGSEVLLGTYSLTPSTSPQVTGPWAYGANQWYRFSFSATSGTTYTFTVCQSGGSYTSDPRFALYSTTCTLLATNDDSCGLGPELIYASTVSGTVYLQVRGFSWSAGSATISYWRN